MKKPEIIHYCWFGGGEFSESIKQCIASWHKYFPNYKFICWNENNFDVENNVFIAQALACKQYAFASDAVRVQKLYEMGGTYFDTDLEVLAGMRELIESNDNVLGFETSRQVGTAIMSFVPKHPLIKDFCNHYNKPFIVKGQQNINANVSALTKNLLRQGLILNRNTQKVSDIMIFKREIFFPKRKKGEFCCTSETVAIHRCTNSWMSERQRKRGNSRIWIKFFRPMLCLGRNALSHVLGEPRTENLEIWFRNKLR